VSDARWMPTLIATAVGAAGFWFAAFVTGDQITLTLLVVAITSVIAIFIVVGFSGGDEPLDRAMRSSIIALGIGAFMMVIFGVSGNGAIALIVPVVILGVAGIVGLAPTGDPARFTARTMAVAAAVAVTVAIAFIDSSLAQFIAPLLPLPAVGLADRAVDQREQTAS